MGALPPGAGANHTMAQMEIELILMRQLASHLTMPIFLYGPDEDLLYFNEAAEKLIGISFDDAAPMPPDRLAALFRTKTEEGKRLPSSQLPIVIALRERRPVHQPVRFRSLDGVSRTIDLTAIPLDGQGGRQLGAVAIFWERKEEEAAE
ncbi:MAG: PAS domain-containing protein [Dehalococcoidia bacterium]